MSDPEFQRTPPFLAILGIFFNGKITDAGNNRRDHFWRGSNPESDIISIFLRQAEFVKCKQAGSEKINGCKIWSSWVSLDPQIDKQYLGIWIVIYNSCVIIIIKYKIVNLSIQ